MSVKGVRRAEEAMKVEGIQLTIYQTEDSQL